MPSASRDSEEAALAKVVAEETRSFLRQVLDSVTVAIRGGRFDEAQPVLALGVMLGWWTDRVGDRVVEAVRDTWRSAFSVTAPGAAPSARADAMSFHIAAVQDRLSRSAMPEIPEAAFEQVRLSQSAAALGGWGTEEQARDIAERLAWEPDKTYWRDVKADAEAAIDAILDPLGRPGTPARTYAHKNDPQVKVWQSVRAGAVDKINEDRGDWQVRAERIARTEATAAWNSGALAALADEGVTHKRWVAHVSGKGSHRTRESHRLADGQVVPLSRPFRVGESLLWMPGDPAAPPWETVNCRCAVVGATAAEVGALTASGAEDQARVPRGNGRLSGRWVDMPSAILDSLVPDPEPYVPALRPLVAGDREAFKAQHGRTIPPSWKDVEVDLSPEASLVAKGKDAKGRTVRIYSQAHHDRQASRKFGRLQEVGRAIPRLEKGLASLDGDPTRAAARLMMTEGVRVGSTEEQLGKVQAFGATTLRARHAEVTPTGFRLSFIAKEGIPVEYEIDDPELVKFVTDRLQAAGPDDLLFETDARRTMALLREVSGVPDMKNHDLRTLLANRLAAAALDEITPPAPDTPRDWAALRRRVGEAVASRLRNRPAQALASYINPAIFALVQEA